MEEKVDGAESSDLPFSGRASGLVPDKIRRALCLGEEMALSRFTFCNNQQKASRSLN